MTSSNGLLLASGRNGLPRFSQPQNAWEHPGRFAGISAGQAGLLGYGWSKLYDYTDSLDLSDEAGYGPYGSQHTRYVKENPDWKAQLDKRQADWDAGQKARNRAAHTINGNMDDNMSFDPFIPPIGLRNGKSGSYADQGHNYAKVSPPNTLPTKVPARGGRDHRTAPPSTQIGPHRDTTSDPTPTVIPPQLAKAIAERDSPDWAMTSKERNRLAHASNGNWRRGGKKTQRFIGPRSKAHTERINKKKVNRRDRKAAVIINTVEAKTLQQPRRSVKAAPEITAERRLARVYNAVLRSPVTKPPQLGSTGNMDTKVIHGFYKYTFTLATLATADGFATAVPNATEFFAMLTPSIGVSAGSNFCAPILFGGATTPGGVFTSNTGTASYGLSGVANATAFNNEVGASTPTRLLAAHISLECKCSMVATAQPYIYGGLLPMAAPSSALVGTDPPVYNGTTSMLALNGGAIRNLTSSIDAKGMNVSTVYQPPSATSLQFNSINAQTPSSAGNYAIVCTSVPYVGVTGCPTGTTVTLTVSMYWEVQSTQNNMNYSGWSKGPKVSTEDIFDHLSRFPAVSEKVRGTGAKSDGSSGGEFMAAMAKLHPVVLPPTREELLERRLALLEQKVAPSVSSLYHNDLFPTSKVAPCAISIIGEKKHDVADHEYSPSTCHPCMYGDHCRQGCDYGRCLDRDSILPVWDEFLHMRNSSSDTDEDSSDDIVVVSSPNPVVDLTLTSSPVASLVTKSVLDLAHRIVAANR